VASRPASGQLWLRVVDVLVELVASAVVDLGLALLTLGALPLAGDGLGLVVGRVGALDGLLEPTQRRGDVRPAS
jgi:hypothetical protein